MFELSQADFDQLSIHRLPAASSDDSVTFSDQAIELLANTELYDRMHELLLGPFLEMNEYHTFKGNLDYHPIGQLVAPILDRSVDRHAQSRRIAQVLYQNSDHHTIKSGEFILIQLSDVLYEDEVIEAVGIFKLETLKDVLQVDHESGVCMLNVESGFDLGKLDKGCIIYQTNDSAGYIIATVDKTSRSGTSGFWYDDFLKLEPLDGAYFQTQQYMDMAQSYLSKQLTDDVEIRRGEQVAMLNDASQYFNEHTAFDQVEFEEKVLGGQPEVVRSFQKYKDQYADEMNLETPLPDSFQLSPLAVRKSAKDFKSVLKLDKNFHVYIHGDRDKIEHGIDEHGRKYYKLYYESEG